MPRLAIWQGKMIENCCPPGTGTGASSGQSAIAPEIPADIREAANPSSLAAAPPERQRIAVWKRGQGG